MTLIDFGSPDLCAQVEQALEREDTRRKQIQAATAFILHAWAAERAVKARLRVAERLSWEGLVGE